MSADGTQPLRVDKTVRVDASALVFCDDWPDCACVDLAGDCPPPAPGRFLRALKALLGGSQRDTT